MPRLIVTIENDADIPQSIAKVQTAISPKSIRVEYGVRLLSALNGLRKIIGLKTAQKLPPQPAEASIEIKPIANDEFIKIVGLTDEELLAINRGESCLRVYGLNHVGLCELSGAFFSVMDAYLYAEKHNKKYEYMQINVKSMREYVPSSIAYLNNACVWDSRIKSLTSLQITKLVIDKKIPYNFSQWHGLEGPPPLRISTHYIKSIHENKLKLRSQYFDKAFSQRIMYAATFTDINKAIDSAKSTPDHVAKFTQVIIESEHDNTPRLPTPTVVWDSRIGYTDDRIEIKWKTERLPNIVFIPLSFIHNNKIECSIVGFGEDHRPMFYGKRYEKSFIELVNAFKGQDDFIRYEMSVHDAEPAKYFQCIAQKPFEINGVKHPAYGVLWDSRIETKTAEPITKEIPHDIDVFKVYVWINSTMYVYTCIGRDNAYRQLKEEISKHRFQTYGIIKNAARETIYDSRTPQLYT